MDFIKIEHTLFALPFAYLGAFLASKGSIDLNKIILIATAFTGLRTAAMTLNRIIDREIDALNPRTSQRHIPAGLISLREAYSITFISLLIYFISAYLINELAFLLSPVPAITAYIYPYLKRYTCLSHYVLGLNLAFAPMGGWIAITNSFNIFGEDFIVLIIGIAVIFWVAGFDIIYALQDHNFDIKMGLHSIGAHFGLKNAKILSALNHAIFFILFLFSIINYLNGFIIKIGMILVALLLIYQHAIIEIRGYESIQIAFFYSNALISLVIFTSTLLEIFL